MATNPHFRKDVQTEQQLLDALTIEAIQIHGHDFFYIPRESVSSDPLLGEGISKFSVYVPIEMYFDSPSTGFVPSPPSTGDLISRFGLEIPDAGTFIVSQSRFAQVTAGITALANSGGTPREGDLIYYDYATALFEIKFVEDEMPFYPLGLKSCYQLSCQRFVYGQETINTGITALDEQAEIASSYMQILTLGITALAGASYSNYTVGERVYAGTTGSPSADGKSTDWSLAGKTLTVSVRSQTGDFVAGMTLIGETSGTRRVILSVADSNTRTGNETSQDNEEIDLETNRDSIFDFTDVDPFSEGKY